MLMVKGEVYRCQNPSCRAEVRVERDSTDGFSSPICCCGAEMKKPYEPPRLRRIEPTPEIIALLKQKQRQEK